MYPVSLPLFGVSLFASWVRYLSCLGLVILAFSSAWAAGKPDLNPALQSTQQTLDQLKTANFSAASQAFQGQKRWWQRHKQTVKADSVVLAQQIDQAVASVSLALVMQNPVEAKQALVQLSALLASYRDQTYVDPQGKGQVNLSTYIAKLNVTLAAVQAQDEIAVAVQIAQLQQQWLAVEGSVVSLSAEVYDRAERDLLLLSAYQGQPQQQARLGAVLQEMMAYLSPLVDAQYSWWDAALIPLREGLEALLIVGALLASVQKSGSRQPRNWIIGGSVVGVLCSVLLGVAVVSWFSVAAFGQNNQLINGWAGVGASVMMVYVCYWLHRSASVQERQQSLSLGTQQALSQKKMFSFALLAFLAIVREGLETVIFLIGMAGQLSWTALASGVAVGLAILALLAWLILRLGLRLSLKWFFLVSSAMVFYLCFKFMGSGIHSLQLAGVLPATVSGYLPSFSLLNIYPSWYSSLPQAGLLLAALMFVLLKMRPSLRPTPEPV